MRNLKRVLSLALALVMVLGMMVIGTSAATFADDESITKAEAVDVISAIGVITGDGGKFYPTRTLTREEGAALVCYLIMGKEAADKLVGSGNFSDVKPGRWSAGAIDYCANLGYIKGYPDGTFAPKAPLTAVAYGRMLLGALGYNGDAEGYTGSNWAVNISADMIAAGLEVKGVDMDAQLTREQAAQMTLQAIQAATVWYPNGTGTTVTLPDGTTVSTGAGAVAKVPGTNDTTDKYVELMEKLELGLTKVKLDAEDLGGLAGYAWLLEGAELPVGIYTTESVKASYPAGTKLVDIVKALGVKDTTSTTTEYDVEVYRNGVWTKGVYSVDAADYFVDQTDVCGADLYDFAEAFGTIPNGCSVDVVVTKDAEKQPVIRLLINISYLATITKSDVTKDEIVNDEDTRAVTITSSNGVVYTLNAKNCASFEEIFAAASALKKPTDVLTYVIVPEGDPAADEEGGLLLSIAAPEAVTGTMTSYNTTKGEYVVDGKTYKVSATGSITVSELIGEEAIYLLDANGFILAAAPVEEKAADAVYAYVNNMVYVNVEADGTIGSRASNYIQAELIFADGTTKIVTVAALMDDTNIYVAENSTELAYKALTATTWADEDVTAYTGVETSFENLFVAYEVDEDGYYYLTAEGKDIYADNVQDLKADVVFSSGVVANTKTVFVVKTTNPVTRKPVYTAYTGYANLPAKAIAQADYVGMTDKGVATFVYVSVDTAADGSSADNKTVAYVTGDPTFFYVDGKTKDYYEYTAIINGAATTLKVAADDVVAKGNLYTIKTLDKNGYVSDADVIAMTDYVSVEAADSIVKIGANWKAYDENTVVYVIDKFGAVKTVDITALEKCANALYVTYVKDATNADTNVIKTIIAVPNTMLAPGFATNDSYVGIKETGAFPKCHFNEAIEIKAGELKIVLYAGETVLGVVTNKNAMNQETYSTGFYVGAYTSGSWEGTYANLGEDVLDADYAEFYICGTLVGETSFIHDLT